MSRLTLFVLSLAVAALPAAAADISFMAEAVEKAPGQAARTARIYRMGDAMRMETLEPGERMVRIVLPGQGVMRLLDPQNKVYMEVQGTPVPSGSAMPANPCAGAPPDANCRMTGTANLGGTQTERYELQDPQSGASVAMFWDPQRHQVLRQEMPDGTVLEKSYLGPGQHLGRSVEHWRTVLTKPEGGSEAGEWWYDPEIEMVVREERADGYTRELTSIQVGQVDPHLFQVPSDYRQKEPPAPQAQQPGQPGGYPPRQQAPRQAPPQYPPQGYGAQQPYPPQGYQGQRPQYPPQGYGTAQQPQYPPQGYGTQSPQIPTPGGSYPVYPNPYTR